MRPNALGCYQVHLLQRCLPACGQRSFPSLPGARLMNYYHEASSALLQLINQWLNFTYSRSDAFRYGSKK